MGLDMYAYVAAKAGQQSEYWSQATFDPVSKDYTSAAKVSKPREIAYWRKHPNLHGWMENLWTEKGRPGATDADDAFNGIELELTRDDIDRLEQDLLDNQLPATRGFFFGDGADDYYRQDDLRFVVEARAELFLGLRVFYNSSW